MSVNPHLSKPEHMLALLVHFVLLAWFAWRLTRHSASLSYPSLFLLCALARVIYLFAFAADHIGYLLAATLLTIWLSWEFIRHASEVDRAASLTLAVINPIFSLISVYSVFLATR